MDEQTLAREFTAAVRTEPPLGFDPDEVVTRVARRRHRRRTILLAFAGVVVAAAAAAVAIPGPEVQAPPAVPAVSPRITPSAGDRLWPDTGEVPQPTDARISARAPQLADHLEAVLRKMMPPTDGIRRDSVNSGHYEGIKPTSQRGVQIIEHGGPEDAGYYLAVDVYVPANPVKRFRPLELCAEMKVQISPSTRCRYADVDTGGVLMTSEADTTDRAGAPQHSITVTFFRADGTYVLVNLGGSVGVSAPLPLTAEQLATLARDPGLTL